MNPEQSNDLANKVQALLFAEGDSVQIKKLAQLLSCDEATLAQALDVLASRFAGTGLALVRTDREVALAVSAETRESVAEILAKEDREIGDAGLEVLSILLYEGPSTRATIDYIRGVNSGSTMRTLLARGLVERTGNPEDGREYLYRPTVALLAHLGVDDIKNLPEYATIARELATFKSASKDVFHDGGSTTGGAEHT